MTVSKRGHAALWRARLAIVVLPLLITAVWAWQSWSEHHRAADAMARRHADLVADYTQRVLQTQILLLDQVDVLLAADPAREPEVLAAALAELAGRVSFTRSVAVVDRNGDVVAGSRPEIAGVNIAERMYFSALRDDAASRLVIDRVEASLVTSDLLVVARRIKSMQFEGVVVAAVMLPVLHEFYAAIAPLSEDAAVALIRNDGRVLIRNRPTDRPITLPPTAPPMGMIPAQASGMFTTTAIIDGITRRYAYTQIGDLPLYANAGVALTAIRGAVLRDLLPLALAMLALSLLAWFGLIQLNRRIDAEAAQRDLEFDRQLLEEAERTAALQETLFQEVNHRIRNNLMTIQTLVRLEARKPPHLASFGDVERRIWAISEVHNLLYESGPATSVEFGQFLRTLCANPAIVPAELGISVVCDAPSLQVDVQQAVPAALVVTELLTNAAKHAFPAGNPGIITVSLRGHDGEAEVVVRDTGKGMPAARERHSGFRIVQALLGQIDATLDFAVQGGTIATLRFPVQPADRKAEPVLGKRVGAAR